MGFMAMLPWLIKGGAAIGGAIGAIKGAKKQKWQSDLEYQSQQYPESAWLNQAKQTPSWYGEATQTPSWLTDYENQLGQPTGWTGSYFQNTNVPWLQGISDKYANLSDQQRALATETGIPTQKALSLSDMLSGQAQQWMGGGDADYKTFMDLLRKKTGGSTSALMSTIAPDIGRLTDLYSQAQRGTAMAPRSGASASAATNRPFEMARAVSDLASGARSKAETDLGPASLAAAQQGMQSAGYANYPLMTALSGMGQKGQALRDVGGTTGALADINKWDVGRKDELEKSRFGAAGYEQNRLDAQNQERINLALSELSRRFGIMGAETDYQRNAATADQASRTGWATSDLNRRAGLGQYQDQRSQQAGQSFWGNLSNLGKTIGDWQRNRTKSGGPYSV